ncbi:Hypothetical protein NTJ_08996 [Nesidiocoris tenuis]|uniref:Secreted protein n=1 Tax=Nesidiocoris tenuis TaxID=355587 RepID=A0ABN7B0D6_9HEMI|nr:Hypothetical protein NTJ_08996 [Nesidiocoris tenuis]
MGLKCFMLSLVILSVSYLRLIRSFMSAPSMPSNPPSRNSIRTPLLHTLNHQKAHQHSSIVENQLLA